LKSPFKASASARTEVAEDGQLCKASPVIAIKISFEELAKNINFYLLIDQDRDLCCTRTAQYEIQRELNTQKP